MLSDECRRPQPPRTHPERVHCGCWCLATNAVLLFHLARCCFTAALTARCAGYIGHTFVHPRLQLRLCRPTPPLSASPTTTTCVPSASLSWSTLSHCPANIAFVATGLVACFELAAKRCPQCRAPTADHFPPAETLGTNTLLVRLLREAFGERYKEREDSVAEVRASWKRKFAIYFSHELIFPYQTLLLNLHGEPRYQLMHKRLNASTPADGKRRFAILPRQQTAEGSVGVVV